MRYVPVVILALTIISTPLFATGSVTGRVWEDLNGNALQDVGEPGFSNVELDLQVWDEPSQQYLILATVTTDTNGDYLFPSLGAGYYEVLLNRKGIPANYAQTYDYDGLLSEDRVWLELAQDENLTDVSFAYLGPGSISGRVWEDLDGNALQDPGEPGFSNVELDIQVWDEPSQQYLILTTVTTGVDGTYLFPDLPAGYYEVLLNRNGIPANYAQTYDNDGLISEDRVQTQIAQGEDLTDIVFGYLGPGSISGRVWEDLDGNALQDPAEPGFANVDLDLQVWDEPTQQYLILSTVTTGVDGTYLFPDLPAGYYEILLNRNGIPANYAQTYDNDGLISEDRVQAQIAQGEDLTDIVFGYLGPGSIGGRVWEDLDGDALQGPSEPGFANVDLDLLVWDEPTQQYIVLSTETTDTNGEYLFTNLPEGYYEIVLNRNGIPVNYAQTYDNDGLISEDRVQTQIAQSENLTDIVFGYLGPGSIAGRVWEDLDGNALQDPGEPGFANVDLDLLVWDEPTQQYIVLSTGTTDTNGDYLFPDFPAGYYEITLNRNGIPLNYAQTYDNDGLTSEDRVQVQIAQGEDLTDIVFGYLGPGSIAGRVWEDLDNDGLQDAGEPGFANVDLDLQVWDEPTQQYIILTTVTTDTNGDYLFADFPAGYYEVLLNRNGIPAGYEPTYDNDGIDSPDRVFAQIAQGEDLDGIVFGYNASPLTTGLIGYWPLDDGFGTTAIDASPVATDGSLVNGPVWTTGAVNGALDFDGVDDAISFPSQPLLTTVQDVTIAAWIRHSPTNQWRSIVDARDSTADGYDLYLNPTGRPFLRYNNDTLVGPDVVADGNWHHIVGTVDANGLRLYVDGLLVASGSSVVQPVNVSNHLRIGENYAYGNSFFAGSLDEVRIYQRALDAADIVDLYRFGGVAQPGDLTAGLQGYWNFDEGTGGTAADGSVNAYDATLFGAPPWTSGWIGGGLTFDGTDDSAVVMTAPNLDAPSNLTIAAWVNHPPASGWHSIVDKRDSGQDGYDLYINTNSRAFVRLNTATLVGSPIADNTWHHVVVTYDGNEIALYIDGVLDASLAAPALSLDTTAALLIGENYALNNSFLAGTLDEVRIYDRALDALEVVDLYYLTNP